MPSDDLHLATALLLCLYAGLGGIDGLWLHLVVYRLHRHAPREHRIHTVRAVLMPAIILLFISPAASGGWLWMGAALALVDLGMVAWDAAVETASRRFQHGLPPGEAALHTVLQALHAVVLVLAVAGHPWSAWRIPAGMAPAPAPLAAALLALVLLGSLGYAAVHLWLLRPPVSARARP
jgi:hypothetical protein